MCSSDLARQLRQIDLPALEPTTAVTANGKSLAGSAWRPPAAASAEALAASLAQLRQLCWQVAGVERRPTELRRGLLHCRRQRQALEQLPPLQQAALLAPGETVQLEADASSWLRQAHDLQQRLLVTDLLLEAALFRQESRGGHYRLDAPAPQPFWRRHSIQQRHQGIGTEPVAGAAAGPV